MTIDEFLAIAQTRILTAGEFIEFAGGMGLKITKREGKGFLKGNPKDPILLSLVEMMKREPYRTNVLALVEEDKTQPLPPQEPPPGKPEPPPVELPTVGVDCQICNSKWEPAATMIDIAMLCLRTNCPAKKNAEWEPYPAYENCLPNSGERNSSSNQKSRVFGNSTSIPKGGTKN